MTSRIPMLVTAAGVAALLIAPVRAQYGVSSAGGLQLPFENNRVRITQLSVAPGATLPAPANRVLVYLTADADGRMPAEAVWQSADAGAMQNRGPVRLDAIAIEFKDVPRGSSAGTPPEALDAQYGVDVSTVIDNPRVLVTRQRYGPIAYGGPLHLHPEDVIVVYLRGGYTWPGADLWGASRVRRGDVDVIPANTLHRLSNAGSDPLEFLTIVPR
jgi:quercetin dioxygenase-like cupin family protein